MQNPLPNGMVDGDAWQLHRSVLQPGECSSQKCNFVALIGENSAAKNVIVEQVLADPRIRAICVANPLAAALSLSRLMFQIDADFDGTTQDIPASLVQAFMAHSASESRPILIIKDAETLERQVLLSLQDLPEAGPPGSHIPQVLFVGRPSFNTLLEGDQLARLRDRLTVVPVDTPDCKLPTGSLERNAPSPAKVLGVEVTSPVTGGVATYPEPPRIYRRPWFLGTAIILAEAFVLFAASNDRAVDPANFPAPSQSILNPAPQPPKIIAPLTLVAPELPLGRETDPTASPPQITATVVPDRTAEKPLFRVSPRERLRREFDEFLNRAGHDTAKLTNAQREALFNEFIGWRSGSLKTKPAG